jgi:hypothetical protein
LSCIAFIIVCCDILLAKQRLPGEKRSPLNPLLPSSPNTQVPNQSLISRVFIHEALIVVYALLVTLFWKLTSRPTHSAASAEWMGKH